MRVFREISASARRTATIGRGARVAHHQEGAVVSKPRAHAHVIAARVVLFLACGSPPGQTAARGQTPSPPTGTLEQVLAPIALYPDSLLAQMLLSATDPPKVTELDTWLKANAKLKGTDLQDAAVKAGFEPSFVALVLFPTV